MSNLFEPYNAAYPIFVVALPQVFITLLLAQERNESLVHVMDPLLVLRGSHAHAVALREAAEAGARINDLAALERILVRGTARPAFSWCVFLDVKSEDVMSIIKEGEGRRRGGGTGEGEGDYLSIQNSD